MSRPQGHAEGEGDQSVTLGGNVLVAKRYWWAVVLVLVVATVVAFALSAAQPDRYTADATLLYVGEYLDVAQLGLELSGVGTMLPSASVEARATGIVGHPLPKAADYTVSAAPVDMVEGGSSASLTPTRVVGVTAEAGGAALAADLANAYARAFVQYRTAEEQASARRSIKAIRAQLATFNQPKVQGAAGFDIQASTYLALTQQLRQLEATASTGNGGYTILAEAVPPTEPSSPKPVRSAILGFGVGLFAAIILVILLHRFDSRVGSEREVATLLRLPVLARLPRSRDERGETGHLVSLAAPAGSAAEAYRRLRASLSVVLADNAAKTLLFASGREGEGTSAALANVGVALARTGRRVVAVDADLRSPSLHGLFNLPNDAGISSVVSDRMSLSTALQQVDVTLEGEYESEPLAAGAESPPASLDVLTSGPSVLDPGELVAGPAIAELLAQLKTSADIVLVDAPGLLDAADASSLASVVDGLVFIVDVKATSRPALRECREYLDLVPCRQLGVVIMQESRRRSRKGRGRAKHAPAAASEASESAAPAVSANLGG